MRSNGADIVTLIAKVIFADYNRLMNTLPTRILSLDAATTACSVALWVDGQIVAKRFEAMSRGQSEALLPMVSAVLKESGIDKPDLIAVTVGPGAFTGIRIGLAAARGLGLAWNIPVAGISTTLALAATVPAKDRQGHSIVVVLDSKREDRWVQVFDDQLNALTPPQSALPDQIKSMVTAPAIVLDDPTLYTDASIVAQLAADGWKNGTTLPPQPLYLRPADVTMPKLS